MCLNPKPKVSLFNDLTGRPDSLEATLTDLELIAVWEKKLIAEGLGEASGHDPHVLKYGFTPWQLEDLHGEMTGHRRRKSSGRLQGRLTLEAHQMAVLLNQQAQNRQGHASRGARRAAIKEAKKKIREQIWGNTKSTT